MNRAGLLKERVQPAASVATRDPTGIAVPTEAKGLTSIWQPAYFALLAGLGMAAGLVGFYLYWVWPLLLFPADILMWAETDFVGDIIKLRLGMPVYTAPEYSNSMIYTPAAPLLTYGISWAIGQPTSIAAWRLIQLGFVVCAALLATSCCRKLYGLAFPHRPMAFPKTWLGFTFLAMFLASTSPRTNSFVYTLHADALALLVSVFSFWTVLLYLEAPSWRRALLMAVCPALGYLTKPFLISWMAVMFVFLVLHDHRRLGRLMLFAVSAVVSIVIAVGTCYLLWGDAFIFWTFTVMGGSRKQLNLSIDAHGVSLLRSLEHTLRAWLEIAVGIAGGWLMLRGANFRGLGSLWVAWLALIASEAFSSGAGWGVLYHFGPGVVIGSIWLFAALPGIWPRIEAHVGPSALLSSSAHSLAALAGVLTIFMMLHVVPAADGEGRDWQRAQGLSDAYRYIADIEEEFEGLPADKVLLDIGNWIYLRNSVLQRDRAISLADQPPGGIYENTDVMVSRIRSKTYERILVRDLHSPYFLYDWQTSGLGHWDRPSGVREALLDSYEEVRVIPAPAGAGQLQRQIEHIGPVSVLIPRPDEHSE